MKKFIFAAIGVLVCLMGLNYAVYYKGFYIDFHPKAEVQIMAKTDGRKILLKGEDGKFQNFTVKSVDLESSIPGHNATDYAVDEDTWMRWFGMIREMGANVVRISTIYNDIFYNSFYKFNSQSESPLYLLQGLQVSDYANHSSQDAYSIQFYDVLKKDSLDVIDVLHGKKNIVLNRMKGSGSYRKDVSPWVLGYVVGNEWDPGTIAYTDHDSKYSDFYAGEYFHTTGEAGVFEAMLAEIMDGMAAYESKKYKSMKLYSFISSPEIDPFTYDEQYARQLGKFASLDAEHLVPTEKLGSGYFASYRLYEYCPGFAGYFSARQKVELGTLLTSLDQELYYEGYTQLLSGYHTMPVVVTGYGFSSSRGTDSDEGPFTETEQGERLMSVYDDIVSSGCAGASISSWQDVWERRTWNTSFAVDVANANQWHDIQTDGQGYGILSFDPGEEKSVVYVDGDPQEWTDEDILLKGENTLSVKYDERCLYLLIKGKELTGQTEIYIPMDITPNSGSEFSTGPSLRFQRAVDFILCIQGKENSRLLVQSRYEAMRENYLMQTEEKDPFETFPDVDSTVFVPIRMVLQNRKLVEDDEDPEQLLAAKRLETFETGKLTYGNGDPENASYDSLADFCFGTDCVEVRIPWQLLNFWNPAAVEIHDDYYKNYGVEGINIQEIFLGMAAANEKNTIEMRPLKLENMGNTPSFHERLKQSYRIVKKSWGGTNVS